jgi:hypothetical protein
MGLQSRSKLKSAHLIIDRAILSVSEGLVFHPPSVHPSLRQIAIVAFPLPEQQQSLHTGYARRLR